MDVGEELADHGGFFGTAPDYGVAAVAEEEAEGHAVEGGGLGWVGVVGGGGGGGCVVAVVGSTVN